MRSIVYFVLTVGLEMALGVTVALCVHELVKGRGLATSLMLLPMFMAPVIVGLLGRFLIDPPRALRVGAAGDAPLTGDILGGRSRRSWR